MPFSVSYSDDFEEQPYVEKTIREWQDHHDLFHLKTSGSTGVPKDIALSRKLLIWSCENSKKALNLKNESILCCLPIHKTGGFMQLIRALHFEWHIHFEQPHASPLLESDFSLVSFSPMQLSHVLQEKPASLDGCKHVLIGGGNVNDSLENEIKSRAKNQTTFWETYGMTETASHVGLRNISKGEKLFTPLGDTQITDENGILSISIPSTGLSLKTNDLGIVLEGKFAPLGRADDVINSGTVKIHPSIIEPLITEILASLRINRKLFLGKKPDKELGEKAILVLEGDPIRDVRFILEILKRELPPYTAPKEIVFVPKINHTDTGKIIRKVDLGLL